MPDTVVRYRYRDGRPTELPIRFLGKNQNFVLRADQIEHRMSADISPRLLDLLEIASAIFCADSTISRGGNEQPRDGRSWRRKMSFEFAVRDRSFWENPDTTRHLQQACEFMTDDEIDCRFVDAASSPNAQSYFRYQADAPDAFRIDDVVLFSGGLDSLVGALETLSRTDKRIALVTHRSAPKTIGQQNDLIELLRHKFKDRFIWIPVHVHRKKMRSVESTQRSRSLLFGALGCVVARMLGAHRVQFFENGIVSQNLPFARPIVGTLATRTTHPQTLQYLQNLLSAVSGNLFDVTNDFEWQTKADVVGRLAKLDGRCLISKTVSCNHTFRRTSRHRHCGSCSQCLDRRFAILANGLARYEREGDYATDVLFGIRSKPTDRALAVEWVRHARLLSNADLGGFGSTFMSELLRISSPFSNRSEAFQKSFEMHQRHGQSVMSVLAHLENTDVANAPRDSLVGTFGSMITGKEPAPTAQPDPLFQDEVQPTRAAVSDAPVLELAVRNSSRVALLSLQDFSHARARLLLCLLDRLEQDRMSGKPIAQFRPMKAREIANDLGVTEEYVRQEVRRIREMVGDSWREIYGTVPPKAILIRTCGKAGYMLDPSLHVVRSMSED